MGEKGRPVPWGLGPVLRAMQVSRWSPKGRGERKGDGWDGMGRRAVVWEGGGL